MSIVSLIIVAMLTGYAIYKQTRVQLVTGRARFRLAIVYAIAGLVLGFAMPHRLAAVGLIVASLLISVVVGLARGACTRVWREGDGRVFSRGSAVTIGLFVALIASKFGLGFVADRLGIHESSVGEILLMISVSVAIQAELVWRRAQALRDSSAGAPEAPTADRVPAALVA
jgi:hypothetical protein